MDHTNETGAVRRTPCPRALVLGALACAVIGVPRIASSDGVPRIASCDPRFGDSSWVAPGVPTLIDGDHVSDGPRVAPPDHEPGWETAMRMPFRVAFFPLRLVARGLELGVGEAGEKYAQQTVPSGAAHPPKPGVHVRTAADINGLTTFGLGPSITWVGFPVANARLRLGGTWSTIGQRRVHLKAIGGDHQPVGFLLRGDYDLTPNRHYYGIGNDSPATGGSHFLLEATSAEAALLFGASPLRQVRLVAGYSSMSPRRGSHGLPLLETVYDPANVPFYHEATQELLYGVTGDFASLDDAQEPSLGVHGRVGLRHAVGQGDNDPDYNEWLIEGRAYVPVFARRRVLALRALYTGVDPTAGTTTIPYYRLAQSAHPYRFAGYQTGRFRDRQLVLAHVEYRWWLWERLQALALYELGEVAPRAADFTVGAAHTAYGGGLRYGMGDGTAMRIDAGKSAEGLTLVLQIGSDF